MSCPMSPQVPTELSTQQVGSFSSMLVLKKSTSKMPHMHEHTPTLGRDFESAWRVQWVALGDPVSILGHHGQEHLHTNL